LRQRDEQQKPLLNNLIIYHWGIERFRSE
jgi:hypothetical protein